MVIMILGMRRAASTAGGDGAVEKTEDTFGGTYQLQGPSAPASESRSRGGYYRQISWKSGCDQHRVIIAMEQMFALHSQYS